MVNFGKNNVIGLLSVDRGPYFPSKGMILEMSSEVLVSSTYQLFFGVCSRYSRVRAHTRS